MPMSRWLASRCVMAATTCWELKAGLSGTWKVFRSVCLRVEIHPVLCVWDLTHQNRSQLEQRVRDLEGQKHASACLYHSLKWHRLGYMQTHRGKFKIVAERYCNPITLPHTNLHQPPRQRITLRVQLIVAQHPLLMPRYHTTLVNITQMVKETMLPTLADHQTQRPRKRNAGQWFARAEAANRQL